MSTIIDNFNNTDLISSQVGSTVSGGALHNLSNLGNCLYLDGVDGHVDLGTIGASDPLSLVGSDFTIHAWLVHESGDDYQRVFDKSGTTNSINGYGLYVRGQTTAALTLAINNTLVTSSAIVPKDGKMHHIGAKSEGSLITFYFDGVPFYSGANSTKPPSASAPARIGKWNSTGRSVKGYINKVYVHNIGLSDAAMKYIANTTEVPTINLVDGWEITEGTGTSVASYSGNVDGTVSGGASWSTDILLHSKKSRTISTDLILEV